MAVYYVGGDSSTKTNCHDSARDYGLIKKAFLCPGGKKKSESSYCSFPFVFHGWCQYEFKTSHVYSGFAVDSVFLYSNYWQVEFEGFANKFPLFPVLL